MNRRIALITLTLLIAASTASAQTTRPFRRGEGQRGMFQGMPRPGMFSPITDEERAELEQFMKSYSPKRWEKFQEVPEDRKNKIIEHIRVQHRWMQRLKEEDPRIYDIRLRRLPIEDEMFALGWELRQDDSKSQPELRRKLREQVRLFVQSSFDERKARLDRWRERLRLEKDWFDRQQADFQRDSANVDALVEKGIDAIESDRGGDLKSLAGPMLQPRPFLADPPPAQMNAAPTNASPTSAPD